ncbi:uncharacterized protein UV8b_04307 [Ustilaginoidea virens]|uniref:Uncharacterized protein n=1 Tax=Ustilaginoidea virens TaxID=1159556 RepID=A0A8E5HR66_USTVR|nr:uncharacterized protein UV8b_04307 [Ustilaginoidea virens]QUC20066.1 hypothetical protein UV8b_04307 [Ustilaginoidea virens]
MFEFFSPYLISPSSVRTGRYCEPSRRHSSCPRDAPHAPRLSSTHLSVLAVLSTYFIRPTPHLKHGPARGDSQQGVGTLPRPCCVIQKALDFSQDGFRESVASESFFSPAAIGSNFSALVKFLGLRFAGTFDSATRSRHPCLCCDSNWWDLTLLSSHAFTIAHSLRYLLFGTREELHAVVLRITRHTSIRFSLSYMLLILHTCADHTDFSSSCDV